jgi:histidinol-phosphate aminotransferase
MTMPMTTATTIMITPRPVMAADTHDINLRHHGDSELAPGLVDLAVNVRRPEPPAWLRQELARTLTQLAAYPDPAPATHAVAARHGRRDGEVLLTAGAAEAFVLIARALRPECAVVVHPQFTEPEAALRAAGHPVRRVLLPPADGFRLAGAVIPDEADLVIVGNPTNPTSVLHPAAGLAALARPGRVLVVDEAFMDAVPGEPESLAGTSAVPGLLVVRSLTKTWALAGLRIGYLLGAPGLLERLRQAQPLWAVSTPALAAALACSAPHAVAEADALARAAEQNRGYLTRLLHAIPGVEVTGENRAPFILMYVVDGLSVRDGLRRRGFAVRRGDTFPGLGPDWLRVAVRDRATSDAFAAALREVLTLSSRRAGRAKPAKQPALGLAGGLASRHVRQRRPTDHDDWEAKLARGVELGLGQPAAAVLGDEHVDPVPAHQRTLGGRVVRAAGEENLAGRGQRAGRRVDAADQEPHPVQGRERGEPLPPGSQEGALPERRQHPRGVSQRLGRMPRVTIASDPGWPDQAEHGRPGARARGRGVLRDARRERVSRVDDRGRVLRCEPVSESVGAAESADPHLPGRQRRVPDPSGQR